MTYLFDTNVISELRKRTPDPNVLSWYDSVSSREIFLSVLTIGEIRLGIEQLRRRDGAQAERLDRWLHGLLTAYADRIIDVDIGVAEEWARLNVPDRLPVLDGLLAATAKRHGWTLVTRNASDVVRSGVSVLNPFQQVR